jgi:hypothetical protein
VLGSSVKLESSLVAKIDYHVASGFHELIMQEGRTENGRRGRVSKVKEAIRQLVAWSKLPRGGGGSSIENLDALLHQMLDSDPGVEPKHGDGGISAANDEDHVRVRYARRSLSLLEELAIAIANEETQRGTPTLCFLLCCVSSLLLFY